MVTNTPNLMTGSLWFVNENEDGTEPVSLKEFKNNTYGVNASAELLRGNIIPRSEKAEQHLIFDYINAEYDETASLKLFLDEDGTVSGKIEYPVDYNLPKQYFKGCYSNSKSEILIWGVWATDADFKLER